MEIYNIIYIYVNMYVNMYVCVYPTARYGQFCMISGYFDFVGNLLSKGRSKTPNFGPNHFATGFCRIV